MRRRVMFLVWETLGIGWELAQIQEVLLGARRRAGLGWRWLAGRAGVTKMALWQLLILICFALPIGASLSSAEYAKVGFGGHVLAIAVGSAVGGCCAWTMWIVHKVVVANLIRRRDLGSPTRREWYFRAFYFAKFLWIVFAGFLGLGLSSLLLHIFF
jgi:hypothetical protein